MAASVTKMGLHRSSLRFQPHFYRFLALENLAQPRDGIIFKQALKRQAAIKQVSRKGAKPQSSRNRFRASFCAFAALREIKTYDEVPENKGLMGP